MLEYYYKERRTLVDFRRGPLGAHFDSFAPPKKRGYSHSRARGILGHCCLFNTFLVDRGIIACQAITPSLIEPFLDVYLAHIRGASSYCPRSNTRCSLKHLFAYLVGAGVLKPVVPKPAVTRYSWMLNPYLKYLREECQRTEGTVQRIYKQICHFLESLGDQADRQRMKSLSAETIESYVKKHLDSSQDNLQSLACTLRGFFGSVPIRDTRPETSLV